MSTTTVIKANGYRDIREEDLLTQLLELVNTIDIDELSMKEKLTKDLDRYQNFMNGVLNTKDNLPTPQVDMRSYAKYVLREGSRDEKHEVLSCLKSKLQLKDQKIQLL